MLQETETQQAPAEPQVDAQRVESAASEASTQMNAIIAALRTVHDPEIPVNIYDLGLIYRIEPTQAGRVEIDMTLTAPGCPVAGEMLNWVRDAVTGIVGIDQVIVKLVFDPPWDQSKMTEEAKLELGLF